MQSLSDALGVARIAAEWIGLALESAGAVIIVIGALIAMLESARAIARHHGPDFRKARLSLSSFLALALEFQLAADILETSISPDWQTVGHLAAIAAIRTALNYFLDRD